MLVTAGELFFQAPLTAYPGRPELLPDFEAEAGRYVVRFARTPEELDAALRLRFEVFNLELSEGLASSFLTGLASANAESLAERLRLARYTLVSEGVTSLAGSTLGFRRGFLVADPDGHVRRVAEY